MAAVPGQVKPRYLPEHIRVWYRRQGEPHGTIKSGPATTNEVMERLSRVYKAVNGRAFEHVLIRPDGIDVVETQIYFRPNERKRFLHDVQQYLFTLEQT